jgi:peptide-methionine (R)-S-oxide reductase
MKSKATAIILLATFLALSCQNKSQTTKSKAMNDSQKTMNPYYSRTDTTKLNVSDAEWKKVLPDSIYRVARLKGTEYAFSGKYWNYTGIGTYYCAACGNKLFRSDAKFASSCGWPSFFETVRPNAAIYKEDNTHGMERTEVLCGRCGAHLGHIFDDGPPPTGKRFCMNSIVLDFVPDIDSKEK